MPTIDELLTAQKTAQAGFEQQVKAGESAQTSLAQVRATLQDLTDLEKRRDAALAGADGRNAEIDAAVKAVTDGLPDIDAWLTAANVQSLDELVAKTKMAGPLDKDKTYSFYVAALASAQGALATARSRATAAADVAKQRQIDLDRAQDALKKAGDAAANAASEAKAAIGDAAAAKTAGDKAKAYWARTRVSTLVSTTVPDARAAVTAAKDALGKAVDACASAAADKSAADAKVAEAQSAQTDAATKLNIAAGQVLAAVSAALKSPAPSVTPAAPAP